MARVDYESSTARENGMREIKGKSRRKGRAQVGKGTNVASNPTTNTNRGMVWEGGRV